MTSETTLLVNRVAASTLVGWVTCIALLPGWARGVAPPTTANAARTDESARVRFLVHEAFAQPLEAAAKPAPKVGTRPGAPLPETPAAVKPTVSTAIWIPGYWAWDCPGKDEPCDFVWVPGVWRVPPPGMRWVPGYGSQEGDGWRWVRGFWYPRNEPRLRYLPAPPPPQEEPELTELADGQFAVLGYWSYAGGRYVWNRGFKAKRKEGWVWIPSHYVWTPAGNLFLHGYWDCSLERRGLLFAPSPSAAPQARTGPTTPKSALNLAALPQALVASADFGHYYFEPRETDAARPTMSLSELARGRDLPQRLTEVAPESLPRIFQGADGIRLLAVQRSKFESSGEGGKGDPPMVFYLPLATEPTETRSAQPARGEAAGQYVPGVAGRRVPGAAARALPGMSGRTVPGVDTNLPGVVAPGVLPGADTAGALPGKTKP